MKVEIDNDYRQKVMTQTFGDRVTLATGADVAAWRAAWMGGLSSWHSPYKALVDCANLTVGDDPEVAKALELMLRFFTGFHLRKAVGYNRRDEQGHARLPFPVHATLEEAAVDVGIRQPAERAPTDFRSSIHLQNDFQRHVVELSFATPVTLATKEQVATLRSKLMNNLMQWHSKWSLLIDCANLEIAPEVAPDVERMFTVLKGFFMKRAIGYAPRVAGGTWPFEVFRARHRAAGAIESEGNISGDAADCKSKQT